MPAGPTGCWLRDLPRDSIHHDSLKAFPYKVTLLASQTSIWDFFQPMEPLGIIMVNIYSMKVQTLTVLNAVY